MDQAFALSMSAEVQAAGGFMSGKAQMASISTEDDNAQTIHELCSQPCSVHWRLTCRVNR